MSSEAALIDCISVLEDVIRSHQDPNNRHDPTPSDFFGIIVTLLGTGATEERTGMMLHILAAVVPKTSATLLRTFFKPVFQALGKIIQSTDENPLIEICLNCMGLILKEQETTDTFWNSLPALQATNTLLTFIDGEPRLRKATFRALQTIAEHHTKQRATAFRSYLGEFVQGIFRDATRTNYRRAHCVVVFLESALPFIPDNQMKRVVDCALKLQDCGIPRLTAAVYRMIDSFLQSPNLKMSTAAARSMVKLLIAHYPSTLDVETHCHYISSLASSVVSLHEAAGAGNWENECFAKCLLLFQRSLESEFAQVHVSVAAAFKRIAFTLVTESTKSAVQTWLSTLHIEVGSILDATGSTVPVCVTCVRELVSFTTQSLTLLYAPAWNYVLDCIRAIFQLFRGHQQWSSCIVTPLIVVLGEVYTAVDNQVVPNLPESVRKSLLETLGTSLQSAGLKKFLTLLPLLDTTAAVGGTEVVVARDWVITILHDYLSNCTMKLSEFVTVILPLAQTFNEIVLRAKKAIETAQANNEAGYAIGTIRKRMRIFKDKVIQVWSLFPEICGATLLDIPTSVPKIMSILQTAMADEEYSEISFFITIGVHRWIAHTSHADATAAIATTNNNNNTNVHPNVLIHRAVFESVAPTLLPLLLQAIEKINMGDSKFKETLDCITSWMGVTPAPVLASVTKKLLQVVLSHTGGSAIDDNDPEAQRQQHIAAIWMAVLVATVSKAPANIVLVMYKTVKPLLTLTAEAHGLQKRAYQLLHALLEQRADVLAQVEDIASLLQVLVSSLPSAHASSRNVRMRCISTVLMNTEDVDVITRACNELGQEILVSLKDANRKTRLQAIEILKVLTLKLPWETLFSGFTVPISTPVTHSNPNNQNRSLTKSASVTALCVLLMEYASKRFHLDDDPYDNADDEVNHLEIIEAQLQMYQTSCAGIVSGILEFLSSGHFSAMLQEETSDQAKAILSLFKLVCTFGSRDVLQPQLARILHLVGQELGCLKHKFASRIRAVYRKLMRKFDAEELRSVVPESDMALLDYLLRLHRKKLRRRQRQANDKRTATAAAKVKQQAYYDKLMNSDSEDEDEDEEDDEDEDFDGGNMGVSAGGASTRFGGSTVYNGSELRSVLARSILGSVQMDYRQPGDEDEDGEENAHNPDAEDYRLLKKKRFVATRSVATKSRRGGNKSVLGDHQPHHLHHGQGMTGEDELDEEYGNNSSSNNSRDRFELIVSEDGKLTVRLNDNEMITSINNNNSHRKRGNSATAMDEDDNNNNNNNQDDDREEDGVDEDNQGGSAKMRRLLQEKKQRAAMSATAQHWKQQKKDEKASQQKKKFNLREPGAEYRAKNAGGDVWKKGTTLQPHAYIPLDPRLLSKKHKSMAVEHFGQVVNNNSAASRKKLKLKSNRK